MPAADVDADFANGHSDDACVGPNDCQNPAYNLWRGDLGRLLNAVLTDIPTMLGGNCMLSGVLAALNE